MLRVASSRAANSSGGVVSRLGSRAVSSSVLAVAIRCSAASTARGESGQALVARSAIGTCEDRGVDGGHAERLRHPGRRPEIDQHSGAAFADEPGGERLGDEPGVNIAALHGAHEPARAGAHDRDLRDAQPVACQSQPNQACSGRTGARDGDLGAGQVIHRPHERRLRGGHQQRDRRSGGQPGRRAAHPG